MSVEAAEQSRERRAAGSPERAEAAPPSGRPGPKEDSDAGKERADSPGQGKDEQEQDKDSKPSGPPRWLLIAIAAAVLVAGGWFGWRWWSHGRLHESTDNAYAAAPIAQISPRVQGHVLRVHVADNAQVEAGAPLFELDPRDMEAQRAAAVAALTAAEARVGQAHARADVAAAAVGEAEAQLVVAEVEANRASADQARYQRLSAAAVAAQERDRVGTESRSAGARTQAAQRRLASARAQVAEAAAGLRAAEAETGQAAARLREAELNLQHTSVSAPFAGRIANKRVEPGDYLRPGMAIMSLVGAGRWVEANFKETQLTDMRPGQPVTLTVDAFPDAELAGQVGSLQRGTGSEFAALPSQNATGNWVKVVQRVPVRIELDEAAARRVASGEIPLAPGMSATVEVRVR